MNAPPFDPYMPGRRDAQLAVSHYDLELDYRIGRNRLEATATLTVVPEVALDRVMLALVGLRVSKVTVAGKKPARWTHKGGELVIRPAKPLAAGVPVEVVVAYAGAPGPSKGEWGEVGWEELEDGVIVAGQPDGARTWFPCHDSPADKASYRIAVTTDAAYTVVANGVLASRTVRSGRARSVFEQREPMATYLATLQIGRYETRVVEDGPVRQTVVAPVRLRRRVEHDLARQPRMMALFRRLFGPYPFDAYTVVVTDDDLEIPLEAQSLAVFGANHMDGAHGSERLVAHELAHQWFGNSLTVERWKDIWLHEGFACYAEWLWSEESGGTSAHDKAVAAHARLAGLPQDLVVGDPGPRLMFDDRLYKRGALTLHALRLALGDDAFFEALRAYVVAYRHGSVSRGGLTECLELETGQAVRPLMEAWLDRPELPELPRAAR